jgi:hypothetical protein
MQGLGMTPVTGTKTQLGLMNPVQQGVNLPMELTPQQLQMLQLSGTGLNMGQVNKFGLLTE